MINSTISVCIIDDNIDFCAELTDFLHKRLSIEVIGSTYDGSLGVKLLNICKPDIVLLDITLPKVDGLDVLRHSKEFLPDSGIIVLYSKNRNNIVGKATSFGADYCVLKPFNMASLATRITKLYHTNLSRIIEKYIQDLDNGVENLTIKGLNYGDKIPVHFYIGVFLARLKFSPKFKGYLYFQSAITQVILDRTLVNSITKVLYKNIAEEFSTTDMAVERSMRTAMKSAWKAGGGAAYYQIFGYSAPEGEDAEYLRPTNGHFISIACKFFTAEFAKDLYVDEEN